VFKISSFGYELCENKHLERQYFHQNTALFMTSATATYCHPMLCNMQRKIG